MLVYLICYAAGYLFSRIELYALSGFVLLFAAVVLFLKDMRGPGKPVRLRALFSLSFVGGEGISCLKLSRLETGWALETWACFFIAYTVFWLVFEALSMREGRPYRAETIRNGSRLRADRLFRAIIIITTVSVLSFTVEALVLGYVPLLVRGVPHAYSYFHVHGLHYFTVAGVLVPSFAVIWYQTEKNDSASRTAAVNVSIALSFLIPLLCVSRFQFLFAAAAALITYLISQRGNAPRWIGGCAVLCVIPFYILLTIARSHSVSYLNGIFEMKRDFPIFISQPYIYIANNYDNFDCLVKQLPAHSYGLKALYPLWTFTGLKTFFPALINLPYYLVKKELTTLTMFYDAWYDFGLLGVAFFSGLLGLVSYQLEKRIYGIHSPVTCVLYAQIAVYLGLAFFTTWFSLPATWFYLAETLAVYLYCR